MTTQRPIVHILGLGAMGTVLAVDLLRFSNAMLVPLFRSEEKLNRFKNEFNSQIGIRKLYESSKPLYTFNLEKSECPEKFGGEKIKNLVITTKTYQTKEAITPYLPYIDNDTNIILIQNGLGVLEVLKEEVFNNTTGKPNLFQGVISHGVYQDKGFIYNHAGWVGMKIARLPWTEGEMIQTLDLVKQDTQNELIQLLTQPKFATDFGIEHMTYQEMLLGQLFKFLINCCMNPVTAIVDCVNGEMVEYCPPVFRSIIEECLNVLRVAYKPLFDYDSKYQGNDKYPALGVDKVLQTDNMVKEVVECGCVLNKKNSSSMRQDTLYLRDTEIDFINGYIVKLAHDFQLSPDSCKVNKTISELVNLRLGLNRTRAEQGDWRNE